MRIKKSLVGLSIVAVAAIGVAVLSQRGEQDGAQIGGKFFPGLLDQINQVDTLVVTSAQGAVTVARGDGWVVKEKNGYPAASNKVRSLVLGMAELRRVEPKTSKPEFYPKLGLAGVEVGDSRSVLVALKEGESVLATLLVGDQKAGAPLGGLHQYYVRTLDDPQVWLVEGRLETEGARAAAWMEPALLDLDESRVRRVEVRHPDGEIVEVRRQAPADKELALVGLQADEQVESAYGVNNIARSLVELRLDDVEAADAVDFQADPTRAVLETFDGLRVSLVMTEHDGKQYGRLEAEFDPALTASAGNLKEGAPDDTAAQAEDARNQAVKYNRLWSGRAYVLPAHQYSGIAVRRDDLVSRTNDAEPNNEKS
ncbi:MAG: DUF4340 domain-containing protein [Gammaproteobacteria bacterium]|nr:DUF4340 domain-containing protein [Gammaproteobacteria bacterium]